MRRRGARRIYDVVEADFPVVVEIEARNLEDCQVVVSNAIVLKGGRHVATIEVELSPTISEPSLIRTFEYANPVVSHDASFISILLSFATATDPSKASYTITLMADSGDIEPTSVGHPSGEEDTTVTLKLKHTQ